MDGVYKHVRVRSHSSHSTNETSINRRTQCVCGSSACRWQSVREAFDLFECRRICMGTNQQCTACRTWGRVCRTPGISLIAFLRWLFCHQHQLSHYHPWLIYSRGQRGRPSGGRSLVGGWRRSTPIDLLQLLPLLPQLSTRAPPARPPPSARHLQICTRINQLDERNFLHAMAAGAAHTPILEHAFLT